MARDGAGTYSLPSGNPVSAGTAIEDTWANTTLSDIATALSASLVADGQKAATADQPMGTKKHTGVGDGTARNHYSAIGQVQDASLITAGTVSGTNTITASLSPSITAYVAGMIVVFEPAGNNTGATTIALNGLTAKAIVKWDGDALVSGDLVTGVPAVLVYDGTSFYLLNPQHNVTNDEVTFARMQNITTDRLLGRDTAASGDPEELTVGGGIEFTGSGGIQRSALTGDVTASAGSNATTIAADAVTYAKMQNVSVTSRVLGRITAGAGNVEELTPANLLTLLLTVDGAGSGLDADTLDGSSSAAFAAASHAHSAADVTSGTLAVARGGTGTTTSTGTGSTVLSASPTFTGTVGAAAITATGTVIGNLFSGSGASLTSIPETAIADGSVLARVGGNETITGSYSFTARPKTTSAGGFLSLVGAGNTGGAVTLSTSDASGTPADGDLWIKYTA